MLSEDSTRLIRKLNRGKLPNTVSSLSSVRGKREIIFWGRGIGNMLSPELEQKKVEKPLFVRVSDYTNTHTLHTFHTHTSNCRRLASHKRSLEYIDWNQTWKKKALTDQREWTYLNRSEHWLRVTDRPAETESAPLPQCVKDNDQAMWLRAQEVWFHSHCTCCQTAPIGRKHTHKKACIHQTQAKHTLTHMQVNKFPQLY